MAEGVKFPHNPVTGSCAYKEKETFTINTFNINKNKLSSALKVDEIKKDIIFLQESQKEDNKQGDYVYTFKPEGPVHNGMLVKDSVFEIDPENNYKYEHRWHAIILRRRTDTKKKIVAISWHGPRKVDGPEKEEAFNELIKFAQKKRRDYSAPVIIGGDFNVVEEKVSDWLKTDEFKTEALKKNELKGYRKGKENIDFFVHSSDLKISSIDSINIAEKLKFLNDKGNEVEGNEVEGDDDEGDDDEGDGDEGDDDEGDDDEGDGDEGDGDEGDDDEGDDDEDLAKKMDKLNFQNKK